MDNTVLNSILRTQGEGGRNNTISSVSSNSNITYPSSDYIYGNESLSSANGSLSNSYSNISSLAASRDSTLANAISGNTSASSAIAADARLSLASQTSNSTQDSYLQYVSQLPNGSPTGSTGLSNFTSSSLYKGVTLPGTDSPLHVSTDEVSKAINLSATQPSVSNDRRIRIRPKSGIASFAKGSNILKPLIETNGFMFPYTPDVNIQRHAVYSTMNTVHSIQDYSSYTGTQSARATLEGTFTAQNQEEAQYMLACFHFMKTCTIMSFGKDSNNVSTPGTPPPVLLLSGYGQYMMNDLPLIVDDFKMDLPADVDYITLSIDGVTVNLPVKTKMRVSGYVQNTPAKLRQFDWGEYVKGNLILKKGWY